MKELNYKVYFFTHQAFFDTGPINFLSELIKKHLTLQIELDEPMIIFTVYSPN